MGAGYAFFPISFAAPFLARPMAFGLRELVRIFSWLSHLLDPVGFISYRIPTPSWIVVAGYFVFLLLLLAPRRFKGQKPVAFAGFAVFFIILITYPFPSTSSDLKVTVLDVGQGDSILVEFPGSRKMLIDGGGFPEGSFDVGREGGFPLPVEEGDQEDRRPRPDARPPRPSQRPAGDRPQLPDRRVLGGGTAGGQRSLPGPGRGPWVPRPQKKDRPGDSSAGRAGPSSRSSTRPEGEDASRASSKTTGRSSSG